jgi:hypothetical protein
MTDVKIGPPVTPPSDGVQSAERTDGTTRTFELPREAPSSTGEARETQTEPAALVQQLRAGQIDIQQAVDILVEQALNAQPMAAGSERLRQDIRRALIELVNDDPTLSALATAMKR